MIAHYFDGDIDAALDDCITYKRDGTPVFHPPQDDDDETDDDDDADGDDETDDDETDDDETDDDDDDADGDDEPERKPAGRSRPNKDRRTSTRKPPGANNGKGDSKGTVSERWDKMTSKEKAENLDAYTAELRAEAFGG